MELEFVIDTDVGLVRAKVTGTLDLDGVVGHALPALLAHEDFVPGMPLLLDATEATMRDATVAEMKRARAVHERHAERRGHAKMAAVMRSDVDYGVARMYAVHSEVDHLEVGIFRDLEDAERWLLE